MSADGFVRLPNWLIDSSDFDLHELALYVALLRLRDYRTNKATVGFAKLGETARLSRSTLKRTIPKLEARGIVKVERRASETRKVPNVYTVAVPREGEDARAFFEDRARTATTRLSTAPRFTENLPRATENLPRATENLGGRATENPYQEIASRINIQEPPSSYEVGLSGERQPPEDLFTFDAAAKATKKQLAYLSDLYLFATVGQTPTDRQRAEWASLTTDEASELIATYWGQIGNGRGLDWRIDKADLGPNGYAALSPAGRRWLANGACPGDAIGIAA